MSSCLFLRVKPHLQYTNTIILQNGIITEIEKHVKEDWKALNITVQTMYNETNSKSGLFWREVDNSDFVSSYYVRMYFVLAATTYVRNDVTIQTTSLPQIAYGLHFHKAL